jgi:hypothetical protein
MNGTKRTLYFALGWIMVALGFIGALLPVMPTTIFLILAVWCFSRSSPRFEKWLLEHPVFGPTLMQWREHGAVPVRIKWIACGGMALGYGTFLYFAPPSLVLDGSVALIFIASGVYVLSRPSG